MLFNCATYPSNQAMTRSQALVRAQSWIDARVPYSQTACHNNQYGSYRTDCSGLVSMAWGLRESYWTGNIDLVSHPIPRADLQPGDALNKAGSHMALFVGWADAARTQPIVREHTGPNGVPPAERVWTAARASGFTPIRYDNIVNDGGNVHHRVRNVDGTWSQFGFLGMPSATQVAAAADAGGKTHVLAITGGQVHHRVRNTDGTWTPWGHVANTGTATAVTAATVSGGNLQVATIINGQPHHRVRYADGNWSPWGFIGVGGGNFTSVAGAIDNNAKVFHLSAVFNGQVHHRVRNTDGTWTAWGHLPHPRTAITLGATVDRDRRLHLVTAY